MQVPISAFIITKNEEARLARTIAALRPWVNEVVVVDCGSTDRTVDLARSMGARVLHRDWRGYGQQKRFAEKQCRNDWVLNVDADEVVTPALADEICSLFRDGKALEPTAFKLRILNVYPGEETPRLFADDYNVVRLYHKSIGFYRDHPVFDRVVLKGTTPTQLAQPIFHYSYISLAHIIEKNNRFSSFRTERLPLRSRSYLLARLWFEFPVSFLKSYVLRRHFTGGWKGFYFSLCYAFLRATLIAKMLERASSVPITRSAAPVALPPLKPARHHSR
ncbi:MAG: glycosyltransferase family 2 protein [Rhodomicrobiaceae bacterium]